MIQHNLWGLSSRQNVIHSRNDKNDILQAHSNGPVLDDDILADEEVKEAIKSEGSVHRFYEVRNTDRALLGRVGGAIAKQHGDSGFAGQVAIDLEVNISV